MKGLLFPGYGKAVLFRYSSFSAGQFEDNKSKITVKQKNK